jgi:hypothetical protein
MYTAKWYGEGTARIVPFVNEVKTAAGGCNKPRARVAHLSDSPGSNRWKGDSQVGIYSLVVIIVMMLAALVATKEPDDDSEFIKAPRRRKAGGYVSTRPGRSLATTAGASPK